MHRVDLHWTFSSKHPGHTDNFRYSCVKWTITTRIIGNFLFITLLTCKEKKHLLMQAWKENTKSRVEKCSGFLPLHWAPEWNYEKQTPPKALAPHLHNQDSEGRGNRKASNPGNTGTQQYLGSARSRQAFVFVCAPPKFLGLWEFFALSKKLKWNWAGLFFAEAQKRLHKGTTRQWGQREHTELHWNMSVRTNPSWHWANDAGKCRIDPGSLMIAAASHGEGSRTCKRTGCSSLVVLWGAAPVALLWAVPGGRGAGLIPSGMEGMGQGVLQQAQGTDCLSQKVGIPHPSSNALFWCKGSAKPTVMLWTSTPKEKLLRTPNSQSIAVLKIWMTQLWSESFYFCLLASLIWFPSYSLNHSEMCFCRQGQLCHSCFPNFKLEDIH